MPAQIQKLRQDVELVIFDFDGVITDATYQLFEDGRQTVTCHRLDDLAIRILKERGMPVLVVSSGYNPVVEAWAGAVEIPFISALNDKAKEVEDYCKSNSIHIDKVLFVGDELNDLVLMQKVGYPVAVASAHKRIIELANFTLKRSGGQGVVMEVVADLLGYDPAEVYQKPSPQFLSVKRHF